MERAGKMKHVSSHSKPKAPHDRRGDGNMTVDELKAKEERELRRAGKDADTLRAHGVEPQLPPGKYDASLRDNGDLAILFGGATYIVEHKSGIHVPRVDRIPVQQWRASCSCGWVCAGDYPTEMQAWQEAYKHKDKAVETAERQRLTYEQIIAREA